MSELRDFFHSETASIAKSMAGRDEFDRDRSRGSIARRRTARTGIKATLSVFAIGSVGAGVWALGGLMGDAGPAGLAPATVTPPATASAGPAITDAASLPTCPSRASTMDDATARRVASSPTTGETWLDPAIAVADPAGVVDSAGQWFQVGQRGENEILALVTDMQGVELFERATSGLTWIARPMPTSSLAGNTNAEKLPDGYFTSTTDIAVDPAQCYESLALPDTVTLADDTIVTLGADALHAATNATSIPQGKVTTEDQIGTFGVVRIDEAQSDATDLFGYDRSRVGYVAYALTWPFGAVTMLDFNPLAGVEDAGITANALVDFFDQSCGITRGAQLLALDGDDKQWKVVGSLRGRDIAVPTADNTFAKERYAAYAAIHTTADNPAMSFADYVALPGLVALRADGGGWWVQIDGTVSPRAWC